MRRIALCSGWAIGTETFVRAKRYPSRFGLERDDG